MIPCIPSRQHLHEVAPKSADFASRAAFDKAQFNIFKKLKPYIDSGCMNGKNRAQRARLAGAFNSMQTHKRPSLINIRTI